MNTLNSSGQPSRQHAVHRRSILAERRGGCGRQQLHHPRKRGLRQVFGCFGFVGVFFFFFPELQFPTTYLDVSNDSCNHVLNLALYP